MSNPVESPDKFCRIEFSSTEQGSTIAHVPYGSNLRAALGVVNVHNDNARWLNCKGFGTCGTCAVKVEGEVSPMTSIERWRLNFPPHHLDANLRLACQVRVLGDVKVAKNPGFWGHQTSSDSTDSNP